MKMNTMFQTLVRIPRFGFSGFGIYLDRLFRISNFGFDLCHECRQGANLKPMKEPRTTQYDLEDRTFIFAKEVRAFVKRIPKTLANLEDTKQVVRASVPLGRITSKRMNP